MGNCQAAEASTVVIQHTDHKVEKIYWSVCAHEVMSSNPGHYVALVVTSPTAKTENGRPVRQLKLLRPDDTLLMGQVYRLISFEDVMKEFAAKKSVKLGKLLKESRYLGLEKKTDLVGPSPNLKSKSVNGTSLKMEPEVYRKGSSSGTSNRSMGRHHGGGGGQWKPALHSISEVGT